MAVATISANTRFHAHYLPVNSFTIKLATLRAVFINMNALAAFCAASMQYSRSLSQNLEAIA